MPFARWCWVLGAVSSTWSVFLWLLPFNKDEHVNVKIYNDFSNLCFFIQTENAINLHEGKQHHPRGGGRTTTGKYLTLLYSSWHVFASLPSFWEVLRSSPPPLERWFFLLPRLAPLGWCCLVCSSFWWCCLPPLPPLCGAAFTDSFVEFPSFCLCS